jgi:import inner membrane translocase subunit TIM9
MDPARNLTNAEKAEHNAYAQEKYRRDSLLMYNELLQSCFLKCVDRFQSKNLTDNEKECVTHCTNRTMKTTQRVGFRYTELNYWDKIKN